MGGRNEKGLRVEALGHEASQSRLAGQRTLLTQRLLPHNLC